MVSPRRFGLRSAAGARLCWGLLPKPDLVILLDLPESVVCRRRPELSAEQVAREYSAWRSLTARTTSAVVLRGDRPIDELRMHTTKLIVEAFMRKNRPAQAVM